MSAGDTFRRLLRHGSGPSHAACIVSSADQGWYLKTLPPFITNAIWRSAVASAR
jgi:hypothetical protein